MNNLCSFLVTLPESGPICGYFPDPDRQARRRFYVSGQAARMPHLRSTFIRVAVAVEE
jgi:hypothetical protein